MCDYVVYNELHLPSQSAAGRLFAMKRIHYSLECAVVVGLVNCLATCYHFKTYHMSD